MKMKNILLMIALIFLATAYGYDNTATEGYFTIMVDDVDCHASVCETIAHVRNDDISKHDFDLTIFSDKADVLGIYEWEQIDSQHENYIMIDRECYNSNNDTYYDCSHAQKTFTPYSYYGWKPAKSFLFNPSKKVFNLDSGINIGKKETKDFKIVFYAPLGSIYKYDVNFLDPYINTTRYYINATPIGYGNQTFDDELRAYWDFEGDYDDVATGEFDMIGTGTTFNSSGYYNQGVIIDAETDKVGTTVTTEPLLAGNTSFTMNFWLNPAMQIWSEVIQLGNDGDRVFSVIFDGTYNLDFGMTTSGVAGIYDCEFTVSAPVISNGSWQMLTVVRNTSDFRVYVNGVNKTVTFSKTTDCTSALRHSNAHQLTLFAKTTNNAELRGTHDEVGVWSRAMGQSEVQALYALTVSAHNYTPSMNLTITPADVGDTDLDINTSAFNCANITYDESMIYNFNDTAFGDNLTSGQVYNVTGNATALNWSIYGNFNGSLDLSSVATYDFMNCTPPVTVTNETNTTTGNGTTIIINLEKNATIDFELGSCPSNEMSINFMWIFLIILIVIGIIGLIIKNAGITVFAGIALMFLVLVTAPCSALLGYFCVIFGLVLMLSAMSIKT